MRLHRFFTDADCTLSPVRIEDSELLHQWTKVLRLSAGDSLILCDGKGNEGKGTIAAIDTHSATINLETLHPVAAEPACLVTLYCSVLKRENFELVVQKSIEAGVHTIVPIIAARTIKTGLKMERLRTIAREAAEQSGRGIIPRINEPMEFDRACLTGRQALSEAKKYGQNLFFHTRELPIQNSMLGAHSSQLIAHSSISIWIGPEGGWTEEEVGLAKQNGCRMASLGALTLRAETAAIVATYVAVQGYILLPIDA